MSLQNPLLTRELRSRIHSRSTFLIIGSFTALSTFIITMMYHEIADHWHYSYYYNDAQSGRSLFFSLTVILLAFIGLISPSLTATAMTLEKEKKTLEMLLMTRLTPLQIITGKIASILSYTALLVLISLPLASVSFILGGISPPEVVIAYAIILNTMVVYGLIGYLCSSFFNQTRTATSVAFLIVLLISVGVLAGAFMLIEFDVLDEKLAISLLFPLSPATAIMSVVEPDAFSSPIQSFWKADIPMWALHFIYSLGLIFLSLWLALRKFNWLKRGL